MGKKPQMGTHVSHQQHQQQIDQQAITPLSGEIFILLLNEFEFKFSFDRFFIKAEHFFFNGKVRFSCADAKNHQQARKNSPGATKTNQVRKVFYILEFLKTKINFFSLLSSSRDSTYRDDDPRNIEELNGKNAPVMGKIAKSSSCSSFLIDILFRGIF
jgi:hypothetical protein